MSNRSHSIAYGLALLFLLPGHRRATAGADNVSKGPLTAMVDPERGSLEWRFKGQTLLDYAFATNQFKPYVRELYSLRGDNVLRDVPSDHLHHHGLMYAIRVNGVNFWEEVNQPGHQRHVKILAHRTGCSTSGLPQATFTELVHWLPHGDRALPDTTPAAFLVERRTLTLTVNEASEEVALAWHTEFEVGARTNRVHLHGSDYNGLGLRLPAAWDRVARHQNSESGPLTKRIKPAVAPAGWSAVSHTLNGRSVHVVLCARPGGQAGSNTFFTMTEPFTYLSATQGLDKAPLNYQAGDRFSLDYLVLVYPAARTPAQIETRSRVWAGELK